MKPAFCLFCVSVESEHPLYIVKHIIKDTCSETSLKVSLVSGVGLLVGPGVFLKVSSVTGMPVLAVDVKVLEYVVKVEVERLLRTVLTSVLRLPSATKLIILPSPVFI